MSCGDDQERSKYIMTLKNKTLSSVGWVVKINDLKVICLVKHCFMDVFPLIVTENTNFKFSELEGTFSACFAKRSSKKVLFLVARPNKALRPPPSPFELSGYIFVENFV